MSAGAVCSRCAEPLVDPDRPCSFCRGERIEDAIRALTSAAKHSDNLSLVARVDAIDTLRSLGFSKRQVLQVRARAVEGHSVEEILEVLGEGQPEAVAA